MKNNKEEEKYRKLKEAWDKIENFFRKDYPAILIGVLFTAAIAFSILSYKQNKGKEAFFVSKANILGEKAGSVSATATVSAQSDGLPLVSSVSSTKPDTKSNSVPSKSNYPININTATLPALDLLPGIGPVIAQKIIDYRNIHGLFRKTGDLLNVNGIGEKKLAQLDGLITVGE